MVFFNYFIFIKERHVLSEYSIPRDADYLMDNCIYLKTKQTIEVMAIQCTGLVAILSTVTLERWFRFTILSPVFCYDNITCCFFLWILCVNVCICIVCQYFISIQVGLCLKSINFALLCQLCIFCVSCWQRVMSSQEEVYRLHITHECINPVSVMAATWRHIIVSLQVCGTARLHWNLDILGDMHQLGVHSGIECLSIGGCRLNGLQGMSSPFCQHPPILASQEQLALKGVKQLSCPPQSHSR